MQVIKNVENIFEDRGFNNEDRWIFYNFWSKVDINDNNECCWNYTKGISQTGYGIFYLDHDKSISSHHMAYILSKGTISAGMQVQHICNNPICCNPNHLELGNQLKNMQYKVKCNRQPSGERNGNSILTEDKVKDIYKLYKEGLLKPGIKRWQITEPIAQRFGVHKSTVERIIRGKLWHHIYEGNFIKNEVL